jgi:hypothetical protein
VVSVKSVIQELPLGHIIPPPTRLVVKYNEERFSLASRRTFSPVRPRYGGLGIYLFVVHVLWGARPLIRPILFGDLNFTVGLVMMFAVGTIMVSGLTLMTPWLEVLSNYPVATALPSLVDNCYIQ